MEKHLHAMAAAILSAAVDTLAKLGAQFDLSNDELCELIFTALEERRAIDADDVARLLTGGYKPAIAAEALGTAPAADGAAPDTGAPPAANAPGE